MSTMSWRVKLRGGAPEGNCSGGGNTCSSLRSREGSIGTGPDYLVLRDIRNPGTGTDGVVRELDGVVFERVRAQPRLVHPRCERRACSWDHQESCKKSKKLVHLYSRIFDLYSFILICIHLY